MTTPVVRVLSLMVVGALLSGCDRLKEFDELKVEASSNKQQLVEVRAQLAAARQQLAQLQAEIAVVKEGLVALESAKRKSSNGEARRGIPDDQVPSLKRAIAECVQVVRAATPSSSVAYQFYASFDAYYNTAAGRVENNNIYNGGLPAVFEFNKCMTTQGFPLS
jgi:hypothetical protein